MSKQKNAELEKNDLADIIEEKLNNLKPYAMQLMAVLVLVVASIALVSWYFINRQAKNEEAWQNLYAGTYAAVLDNDTKTLEQTAKETAGTKTSLIATQLSANTQLNMGLFKARTDREAGFKEIESAIKAFELVRNGSDKKADEILWTRATIGLARANEAVGKFDDAKSIYESLLDVHDENSAFGEYAKEATHRVSNPATRSFFEAYVNYVPEDDSKLFEGNDSNVAPGNDLNLPDRPDFTYPEIIVPDSVPEEEAPPEEPGTDEPKTDPVKEPKTDPAKEPKTDPAKEPKDDPAKEPKDEGPKPPVADPGKSN